MARFLARRIGYSLFVLWGVSVGVFLLFFVAPHDVAQRLAGRQATPEVVALVKRRLGLDQPVPEQYGHFVWRALHGDFGYDYYHGVAVTNIIVTALPKTLSVALGGAVLWLLVGVLNGVVSAVRPRSLADRSLTTVSLIFYSMPDFLLGLLLLYFLYYRLTLTGRAYFPPGGYVALTQDPLGWFRSMVLPWTTLALFYAAGYTRLTRSSLLDVFSEDYIRTARSKGISERRVVYRHGLRSALSPVITQFGIDLGVALGGVVVTETVFGIDGLGREAIQAFDDQNLPVIAGIVLFATVVILAANIVVDMLYAVLDPRIRLA